MNSAHSCSLRERREQGRGRRWSGRLSAIRALACLGFCLHLGSCSVCSPRPAPPSAPPCPDPARSEGPSLSGGRSQWTAFCGSLPKFPAGRGHRRAQVRPHLQALQPVALPEFSETRHASPLQPGGSRSYPAPAPKGRALRFPWPERSSSDVGRAGSSHPISP